MKDKQIKIGAIISYLSIAVNIILGLVYTPWMIKSIGQSDYALYTLATSIITMFAVDFGMSAAVSRYVAKYVAEKRQKDIDNFLGLIYKLYLFISAIILTILVVVCFFLGDIYTSLSPTEVERLRIVYIIAGGYTVVSFPFITFNGILAAFERFISLKICDLLLKLVTSALVIVCLLNGGGVYSLVAVNAIVGLIVIFIKFFLVKKGTSIHVNFKYFDKSKLIEVLGFSGWSTIGSFAHNFLIVIIPSILAVVSSTTEVAVFGFANSIGSYICLLATGIDGFFLPKISNIIAQKREDKILPLMVKVGRFQLYLLLIVTIGFISIGREFITLMMGADYQNAYYCVICYLVYSIFAYPPQIGNTTLIAINAVKERAVIFIIAAILNATLSFPLSYLLGSFGACLALMITIVVRTILLNIIFKRKLRLDVFEYYKQCYLPMLIPFIITLILSMLTTYFITNITWGWFLLEVIIISVIYLIIFFIFQSKEQKAMVMSFFKKQ